jgi:hypothetical protein
VAAAPLGCASATHTASTRGKYSKLAKKTRRACRLALDVCNCKASRKNAKPRPSEAAPNRQPAIPNQVTASPSGIRANA